MAAHIEDLARARGVRRSFGWDTSPFVLQKEKGRYVWQDMARQQPTEFPRIGVLAARIAQATRRGIFAASTFFMGDEMFWGNDRLDDALDFAAQHTG